MTGYPLTKYDGANFEDDLTPVDEEEKTENQNVFLREGPIVYAGEFSIPTGQRIDDTYVDPSGWGKVN